MEERVSSTGTWGAETPTRCMQTEDRDGRSYQCDSYSGHPGAHSFNIDLTFWSGIRPAS